MPLIKCATCGHSIADNAVACPSCGAPNSPQAINPKGPAVSKPAAHPTKKVGFLLGLAIFVIPFIFAPITLFKGYSTTARVVSFGWFFLIIGLIFLGGGTENRGAAVLSTPTPVAARPAEAANTEPPKKTAPALPPGQQALVTAVQHARQQYRAGGNDLAKGAARPARAAEICRTIGSPNVSNWIGKLTDLSTNGDGNGVIEIDIGDSVSLRTWNNALSDIQDATLISPSSPVFAAAMKLKKGQMVRFSGSFARSDTDCFEESSLTLAGSISEPAFIFRFSALQAAD